MVLDAVIFSSNCVSDVRLRMDDQINKAIGRETALLGNPSLGKYTTQVRFEPQIQDQARREKQRKAADLIKSWLAMPEQDEDQRYEILERELKDTTARFREE